MRIYISKPSMITAAGDEKSLIGANYGRYLSKKEFLGKEFTLGAIDSNLAEFSADTDKVFKTRTNQITLSALTGLKSSIDKLIQKYGKSKIGVVIGTTTSGVEENFAGFSGGVLNKGEFLPRRNSLFNPSEFVRDFLGVSGVCYSVCTACTSGIKAIHEASNLVNSGLCDAVVTGGVDSINSLTLFGFDSLAILSKNPCRPFCGDRDGTNLGEGASLMIVSKEQISDICIKSFASNSDAYHITRPREDGFFQVKLINECLQNAGLTEVEYINLHATATIANDKMESEALNLTAPNTPCSGVKHIIGHTLGAAGAVELGVCIMGLEDYGVPFHGGDFSADESLKSINLLKAPYKKAIKNAMSLSFAFGGDNAAMIVGKSDE